MLLWSIYLITICIANASKSSKEGKQYNHCDGFCTYRTTDGEKTYQDSATVTKENVIFLHQSIHMFNTQTNKVLDKSQAYLTLKSKLFHERKSFQSKSYHYYQAGTVGTYNWSFCKYWSNVFDPFGVQYTQLFLDHINRISSRR